MPLEKNKLPKRRESERNPVPGNNRMMRSPEEDRMARRGLVWKRDGAPMGTVNYPHRCD